MIMLAMSTKDIFDDGGHEEGGGDEGCSKHHESQGSTGDVIRLSDVIRFFDVVRFSDVVTQTFGFYHSGFRMLSDFQM